MALKIGTTEPTEIKVIKNGTTTDLTVYKYATTGADLKEATRSGVSTYSKANLDSYVGLQNDTWSGITNASSLVADRYYYIRVLVSDTNKYGKFCVRFKSYSGQTITVENMGWGYDGEVIYSTPVWGKPFTLTVQTLNTKTSITRKTSPNEHASTGEIPTGATVYYGDTLLLTVEKEMNFMNISEVIINDVKQTITDTSHFSTTITVTSDISIYAIAVSHESTPLEPQISADVSYEGSSTVADTYLVSLTINNRNSVDFVAKIEGYNLYGILDNSQSATVKANSSKLIYLRFAQDNGGNPGGEYTSGAYKINVYFEAQTGYSKSNTVTLLLNGYSDETTTTTTTTAE